MLEQELLNILIQYFLLPLIISLLSTLTLSSLFVGKYIRTLIGGLAVSLILYTSYNLLGGFEVSYYYSFAILELLYIFYGVVAGKSEVTTSSVVLLITTSLMILAFLGYIPKFWMLNKNV